MRRDGLARVLLAAHAVLVAFSTLAMVTVLAGVPGPWLAGESAATMMRLGFRFAGPTYIALGALATLAFVAARLGTRAALAVALTAVGVSLGAELAGTATGLPFGEYRYTTLLGWRVAGLVPLAIPLSWFYMLVASLVIVARMSGHGPRDRLAVWQWAFAAGLLMVAWDVALDPAMAVTGHWAWGDGSDLRALGVPGWLVTFYSRDVFYGMPLGNWLGWLLTATVIARLMLAIVPPARFRDHVASSRLPVVLYLLNGVMPVAICLRDAMWWAAAIGAVAMTIPSAMALRRTAPASAGTAWREQPA